MERFVIILHTLKILQKMLGDIQKVSSLKISEFWPPPLPPPLLALVRFLTATPPP